MITSKAELRRQLAAQAAELNTLRAENVRLRETGAGLNVALAEYSRRSLQVQVSLTRVDQSLTLLAAGLAILASAQAGVFAGLWTSQRAGFYAATAVLCGVGSVFVCAVLVRDLRARLLQTQAEQVQARLRNYFVSLAPEVEPYLSDTLHDDWPTPYSQRKKSLTYRAWLLVAIVAGAFAGLSAASAALAVAGPAAWILEVGVAVAIGASAMLVLGMNRWLRAIRNRYKPAFPGWGKGADRHRT